MPACRPRSREVLEVIYRVYISLQPHGLERDGGIHVGEITEFHMHRPGYLFQNLAEARKLLEY
jgi:hypothetical protein